MKMSGVRPDCGLRGMGEGVSDPKDPRWTELSASAQSAQMLACYRAERDHGRFEPGRTGQRRGGSTGFMAVRRQ